MISEKFSNFIRRAEKEESLLLRRPRMLGGALYGFIAGLAYGLTVGVIDAIFFPNLPITIQWGPSILTGVVLGFLLALVGALTGWYTENTLGIGAGAIAIAMIGIGVQLFVVGVGAIGIILLVILAFPISVISLPIAIVLRWFSNHYMRILAAHSQRPLEKNGWMVLLVFGALLLGIMPGSFQRMGIREERSALLIDTALRLAPSDPEQAKRLPLKTLPGLKEHLGTPYTLRVTPSKISTVGYDIHVLFNDGFAITCVTVAYTSTPYLRSCSEGADIIIER
jgi:hypothetical protein